MKHVISRTNGFTLIELLIVISIIIGITTIFFVNQGRFRASLNVEREAQVLALALRDAEIRSISTKQVQTTFQAPFGVHFDLANPLQYILFADTNTSGTDLFYDAGEELEVIRTQPGVRLKKLCKDEKKNFPLPGNCSITSLSITFQRPMPLIQVVGVQGGLPPADLGQPDFEIAVESNDGSIQRKVVVWTTGAVSIEN